MRSIFSTMSMFSECRELPLLEVFCHATRRCLIRQDSLLECPKWLRRRFAPGYFGILKDSPNLDWIAPDDGPWSCHAPWLEVLLFIRLSSCEFFMLFKQKVICKQGYVKNAKLMSVLKILKNAFFFIKHVYVCKRDVNSMFTIGLKESGYLS